MKTITILTGLGIFAAGTAFAVTMTEIDANGDGMVTLDELAVMLPEVTEDTFAAADANSDGMLDAEEYAAAQADGLLPAE